jgi:benzodiazapine receptor
VNRKEYVKLILALLVCQAAGLIGSSFTASAIPTWYASLTKPAFNPPNWVFAPVWITLYVLMGVSLFLVWRKFGEDKRARTAVYFFFSQLVLNAVWTPIFFGLKMLFIALVIIVLLWAAIGITIFYSSRISKPAGYLLIPYIVWVSYAAALNFSLWLLNR